MANRRCLQTLTRHFTYLISPNPSLHSLKSISPQTLTPALLNSLRTLTTSSSKSVHICSNTGFSSFSRNLSSSRHNNSDNDDGENESEEEDTDDDDDEDEDDYDDDDDLQPRSGSKREYTPEEKEQEAAEIGYKVIGPLQNSTDRVFKTYEPVFAVIQIGSHQFKVSNGDCIFTERLKFCEVHDKLILNKVLMLGSTTQTIIGRPELPNAAVHAVVEEHALDAKVIVFKKKRRKNYRRTRGHRQELTKLRITDIQGIEKPEVVPSVKTEKKGAEKVPVAA